MQKKKGISLIVLVITIIVMIILAGAVIISLNNSGIIDRVKGTVIKYNEQELIIQIKVAKLSFEAERLKDSSLTLANFVEQGLENAYGEDVTVEQQNKSLKVTFDTSNTTYKLLPNEKLIKLLSQTSVYGKLVEEENTLYLRATSKDGYDRMNYGADRRIANHWNKDYIIKIVIEEPIAPSAISFTGLTYLETIENISNLHTENATRIDAMFYNCTNLTKLDTSHFDTSKATSMSDAFSFCKKLEELDLSSFDTSRVTDMHGMFSASSKIQSLDLSGFDTSKVTDMSFMFSEIGVKELDLSSFNTTSLTTMYYMFAGCKNLESINLKSFNTSSVTNMSGMFRVCKALKSIDLSNFNTSSVSSMNNLFESDTAINEIDISNFTIGEGTGCSNWFLYLSSMSDIRIKTSQAVATKLMENNSNLTQNNFIIVN